MKFLNFLTWHPKKLKDVLFPVSVINWISGLNIVEIPVGHPRPILSSIYLIIMIILYYYIPFSNGISVCDSEGIYNAGQILFDIIWFYNGFVGLVSIVIGWYYQKVIRLSIQRIELIDVSLDFFGLSNNHGKSFVRLVLTIIVAFSGMILVAISDVFWFLRKKNLEQSIYCSYTFSAPIFLQLIIDLGFGTMVTTIGYSFKNINFLLEKGASENLLMEKVHRNRKQLKINTLVLPAEFNFNTPDKSRNFIQLIKHQHLELSKVAWEVEKVFGLQIAMSMVSNITLVIGNAYYVYRAIFESDFGEESDVRVSVIANGICCCLLYILRVLYVNATCAKVTAYAHKAEELIHRANRSHHDAELRKEIEQFSLQLTQRPLFFSMYGLTNLDYSFVAKFLGTIVTYLIIVIQIEPKPKVHVTDTTTEVYANPTTQIF